jgi:hypothetical protein
MPEIQGDMTQEEIDEQIKYELSGAIASSSDTNPVRLTTAHASRILELLGGYDPEKHRAMQEKVEKRTTQAQTQAAAAAAKDDDDDDDEDDKPTPRGGARRR